MHAHATVTWPDRCTVMMHADPNSPVSLLSGACAEFVYCAIALTVQCNWSLAISGHCVLAVRPYSTTCCQSVATWTNVVHGLAPLWHSTPEHGAGLIWLGPLMYTHIPYIAMLRDHGPAPCAGHAVMSVHMRIMGILMVHGRVRVGHGAQAVHACMRMRQ